MTHDKRRLRLLFRARAWMRYCDADRLIAWCKLPSQQGHVSRLADIAAERIAMRRLAIGGVSAAEVREALRALVDAT